jgi:hypothetical protein
LEAVFAIRTTCAGVYARFVCIVRDLDPLLIERDVVLVDS